MAEAHTRQLEDNVPLEFTWREIDQMTYQKVHPNDGTILSTFEKLTDKQLKAAIKSALRMLQLLKRIQL